MLWVEKIEKEQYIKELLKKIKEIQNEKETFKIRLYYDCYDIINS